MGALRTLGKVFKALATVTVTALATAYMKSIGAAIPKAPLNLVQVVFHMVMGESCQLHVSMILRWSTGAGS